MGSDTTIAVQTLLYCVTGPPVTLHRLYFIDMMNSARADEVAGLSKEERSSMFD